MVDEGSEVRLGESLAQVVVKFKWILNNKRSKVVEGANLVALVLGSSGQCLGCTGREGLIGRTVDGDYLL